MSNYIKEIKDVKLMVRQTEKDLKKLKKKEPVEREHFDKKIKCLEKKLKI